MSYDLQKTLDNAYVMHTYGRLPVEFVSGSGMTLTDSEGRSYTDFLAGIGVCCLGYNHPALTCAITAQAQQLLTVSNYFYTPHRGEVAALLSKMANNDLAGARRIVDALDALAACGNAAAADVAGAAEADTTAARCAAEEAVRRACEPVEGEQVWKTFFSNSGAEANEGAMKLARLYARREGNGGNTIVCLKGGFHGRTLETIAATMQERLQDSFRPLPEGFVAVEPNDIAGLRAAFERYGDQICAFMFEPIQGESGVHPLDPAFAQEAERLVHEVGGLTIADEVQAGVFRCGVPFASQLLGIMPDIMSLAKGIGGGVTMGAVVARAEVADVFQPGDHGSTFGGMVLAVAAAEATLSELVRTDAGAHAEEVGAYLAERLAALPQVLEVRGAGLMRGCDLVKEAGDAHDVVARMLDSGFVINATGAHTLRFLPPLICERAHVDAMVDALAGVLAAA